MFTFNNKSKISKIYLEKIYLIYKQKFFRKIIIKIFFLKFYINKVQRLK